MARGSNPRGIIPPSGKPVFLVCFVAGTSSSEVKKAGKAPPKQKSPRTNLAPLRGVRCRSCVGRNIEPLHQQLAWGNLTPIIPPSEKLVFSRERRGLNYARRHLRQGKHERKRAVLSLNSGATCRSRCRPQERAGCGAPVQRSREGPRRGTRRRVEGPGGMRRGIAGVAVKVRPNNFRPKPLAGCQASIFFHVWAFFSI